MPIKGDTALSSFSGKELAESSAIHGDFNQASINYSGHQNLEVRGAELVGGPCEICGEDLFRDYDDSMGDVCLSCYYEERSKQDDEGSEYDGWLLNFAESFGADWDVSVDKVTHQKQTFHVKDKDYESQAKRKALSLAKKKKGGWKNYPEGAGFATPEYEAWFARRARAESFVADSQPIYERKYRQIVVDDNFKNKLKTLESLIKSLNEAIHKKGEGSFDVVETEALRRAVSEVYFARDILMGGYWESESFGAEGSADSSTLIFIDLSGSSSAVRADGKTIKDSFMADIKKMIKGADGETFTIIGFGSSYGDGRLPQPYGQATRIICESATPAEVRKCLKDDSLWWSMGGTRFPSRGLINVLRNEMFSSHSFLNTYPSKTIILTDAYEGDMLPASWDAESFGAEYGKRQRFGNRYVARDTKGRIISNVSVGRSLKADRRNKSKTPARSGFGHMGDARKGASGEFKLPTDAKSLVGIGAVLGGLWAYLESKA